LFVAAVAIIVVGPKDLPGMFRLLGQIVGRVKRFYSQATASYYRLEREVDLVDRPREEIETPNLMSLLPDDLRKQFEMATPLRDAAQHQARRAKVDEELARRGIELPTPGAAPASAEASATPTAPAPNAGPQPATAPPDAPAPTAQATASAPKAPEQERQDSVL
ncbi:MAG: hypothetical protein AAFX85_12710, partial [Pseudomonadota bacterium]